MLGRRLEHGCKAETSLQEREGSQVEYKGYGETSVGRGTSHVGRRHPQGDSTHGETGVYGEIGVHGAVGSREREVLEGLWKRWAKRI